MSRLSNARAQGQPQAPLTIAARKPDPTWELSTLAVGRLDSGTNPNTNGGPSGTREGLTLGLTHFLAPLQDDGSPYSLRPYLQRTSSWTLSTDIGHFVSDPFLKSTWGDVDGRVYIYVERWLAVNASLGYQYDVRHDFNADQSIHTLYGAVGLAFRAGDLRAAVAYDLQAYRQSGSSASPRQQLAASLFGVFARRLSLELSGSTLTSGGSGGLAVALFPAREVGYFVNASVSHGQLHQSPVDPYQSPAMATRYVGTIGVVGWAGPSIGIIGRLSHIVEHSPTQVIDNVVFYGDDQSNNQLTAGLYVRFR